MPKQGVVEQAVIGSPLQGRRYSGCELLATSQHSRRPVVDSQRSVIYSQSTYHAAKMAWLLTAADWLTVKWQFRYSSRQEKDDRAVSEGAESQGDYVALSHVIVH
ncbi:hypothetical protein V1478_001132 [Vespula squamosa]|uniref:Uncharacterized protein n=1 Tax=Vespula squamosa TaxID=30214 RepID=A0ABD2C7G1_VESSQ